MAEYELITIDGCELLNIVTGTESNDVPVLPVCDDTLVLTESYPRSALLDQLKEQLKDQLDIVNDNDPQLLKKVWIYVDFKSQINENDRHGFERLFIEGFDLIFPDEDKPIRFVPLLSSASQSKKFIYGFVREEIFYGMRERLDLGFDFEGQYNQLKLSYISKLYAYRGLYSSGATYVLRGRDKDAESFFDENNIIVIKEPGGKHFANVYTAEQESEEGSNEVALVSAGVTCKKIKLSYLDGAGMVSRSAAEFINKHLPKQMRGKSFQIRMPFLKGMLHTVDFHKFFKDMGVKADKAIIKDVFGKERDLFKANIIITPSMFKLYGLLSDKDKNQDLMGRYFKMMKDYNHGLYVVKTDALFHNTNYVPLNSQLLSTLDLTAEDLDGLVADHIAEADAYCEKNLMDPQMREELYAMSDRDDWMTLLLREPTFLCDDRIREMLENHRISRYNDISMGRIRVKGENRFLCGDLLYFLTKILKRLLQNQPSLRRSYTKLSGRLLNKAVVYLPGADDKIKEVAILRNPHLSRNEDVCVGVGYKGYYHYYKKYFSHLTGVAFAGHHSYIPAALGGADFDGDHVILSYDERIIRACKSGYVEADKNDNTLPFIQIPTLEGNTNVTKHKYVVPQAVYNTFSNRIGIISNAAMKIAAVEYDTTLTKDNSIPSAALCTILTGTEIDASKKGLRPDIDNVISYKGKESDDHEAVVEDVETYLGAKKTLESFGGCKPSVIRNKNNEAVSVVVDGDKIKLRPNRDHNAVTQLLYRWTAAFEGFFDEKETEDDSLNEKERKEKRKEEARQNLEKLSGIFSGDTLNNKQVSKILTAYNRASKEYSNKQKNRCKLREKTNENNAKIFMRLMCQYDDINVRVNEASYRYQMESLQDKIITLTDNYTTEEVEGLCEALFSDGKDKFNANTFWPYGRSVEGNKLLEEILELPEASLLKNFRSEGYRILYYLLDNAINVKKELPPDVPEESEQNPYTHKYLEFAAKCFLNNYSASAFKKKLREEALYHICIALDCEKEADMIPMIYPPESQAQRNAFWEIFTARDMLNALGGDTDVR